MQKALLFISFLILSICLVAQPTEKDIAYGEDPLQKLDYYKGPVLGSPIMLIVHGGGWAIEDKNLPDYEKIAQLFNNEGYAIVNINYRLSSQLTYTGYPSQPADLACALAWTKNNALLINGDPGKIILYGNSAGGHLVTLHALSSDNTLLADCDYHAALGVRAVISTSGAYDFDLINPARQNILNDMLGDSALYWETAQPINHVAEPDNTKFLLITGQNDDYLGTDQAISFNNTMQSHHYCTRFYFMEGYDHGVISFINADDPIFKIMKDFTDSLWNGKLCNSISATQNNTLKNIQVYPNPTQDILYLKGLDIPFNNEIFIYDFLGRLQYRLTNKDFINLENIPAGLYLLKMTQENNVFSQVFLKQ